MSFDVYFQSFPKAAKAIADIPATYKPPPLGPRDSILKQLKAALPSMKFRPNGIGEIKGDGISAELYFGDDDPCRSFMIVLRGGPMSATVIEAVCRAGFRAVAPGVDAIITSGDDLGEALEGWRKYRDQMIAGASKPGARGRRRSD